MNIFLLVRVFQKVIQIRYVIKFLMQYLIIIYQIVVKTEFLARFGFILVVFLVMNLRITKGVYGKYVPY